MPNWCSASYAIEGDAEEVKSLYKLMKRLQEQKEPSVPNGFGKTWLGCLVNALGGDYNKIHCRGDWSNLEMEGNILKFTRHPNHVLPKPLGTDGSFCSCNLFINL